MKRSEMIALLAHQLERYHDRYGNLYEFNFVAEELLEDIEGAGMLPPEKAKKLTTGKTVGYINEWEEEDA